MFLWGGGGVPRICKNLIFLGLCNAVFNFKTVVSAMSAMLLALRVYVCV